MLQGTTNPFIHSVSSLWPWLQSYHDNKRVQIICYISGVESIKAALHYCYDLTRINN